MLFSESVRTIQFDSSRRAYCFFTTDSTTPQDIISGFNFNPLPKGVICISGGATQFPPDTIKTTIRLVEFAIAPLVDMYDLLVIDGGTEAGVMEIVGKILRKVKCYDPISRDASQSTDFETLPLMGFAPESKVFYPGIESSPQCNVPLDRNHTYFVLVTEAQDWGEEVDCMFSIIDYLAKAEHLPIVHIIANGGRITIKEAYHSVQQGHDIIVLEGSARASQVIVAALDRIPTNELIALLKQVSFELTEQFFKDLRNEYISEDILENLKPIENEEFIGKDKFLDAVKKQIGEDQILKYEELILKHALKQHAIATQSHEIEETLLWLKEIAEYDKIVRFDFWLGRSEELKDIIFSKLALNTP